MDEIKEKLKDDILVMDLTSIPKGWDIERVMHHMKKTGVLFVDSANGGRMPYTLHPKRRLPFTIKEVE